MVKPVLSEAEGRHPCLRQEDFFRHKGVLDYHCEKACQPAGLKTATHTVIRYTQLAIPARAYPEAQPNGLLLSKDRFRFTNQSYSYQFFGCCQVSFHYDAFLWALRDSLAEASLALR